MTNEGNILTQKILKGFGFDQEISEDDDGDEIKYWYKNGVSIHEDSWWIKNGVSIYKEGEVEPQITFAFATNLRSDGSFKSGFSVKTDTQLKNIFFALISVNL